MGQVRAVKGLVVAREELSEQLNSVELGALLTENNRTPGVSWPLQLSSLPPGACKKVNKYLSNRIFHSDFN